MTDYSAADDLALALALAGNADLISLDRFTATDLKITTKPDRTPVTDADKAVEQSIRAGIDAARPGDSILGEEFGTQGSGSRQWIIDPIDGTSNFMRGVPIWATLIALAIDGVPVVGVVSSPALKKRWWAAKGHGAWAENHGEPARQIHVSGVDSLQNTSLSYNNIKGWDAAGHLDPLLALQRSVWKAQSIGDAWAYMLVAEGLIDAAGEWDMKPYDIAALAPIVEEAGGRMTSLDGVDGPWDGSALATNGIIHDEVLAFIARGAQSV